MQHRRVFEDQYLQEESEPMNIMQGESQHQQMMDYLPENPIEDIDMFSN